MNTKIQITLSRNDLGQLLEGLRARAEAWCRTADFIESGFNPDDSFIPEDASDAAEARLISSHYARIISSLEKQTANLDPDQ